MSQLLYVISDLHLGGRPGTEMCSLAGRRRLIAFLQATAAECRPGTIVHLVIAGDVVDFLAEEADSGGWAAFSHPAEALRKFRSILATTRDVWLTLAAAVQRGVRLTLLIGNHDIELSLFEVRQELLRQLSPGHVEFIYDNEAFRLGPVLVEHGNRYDPWNAVRHDSLRRFRSRTSRNISAGSFSAPPGSELVARVMNPLKARYAFIDLLKPETEGVLPLLAALDGSTWLRAWPAIYAAARTAWRSTQYDRNNNPRDNDYVAAVQSRPVDTSAYDEEDAVAFATTRAGEVPVDDFPYAEGFREALALARAQSPSDDHVGKSKLALMGLRRVLEYWVHKDTRTWRVDCEHVSYSRAAQTLLNAGARVVIFGHTHLAKRVSLSHGTYLNTGTWADLMKLPSAIFESNVTDVGELTAFLDRLRTNDLVGLRRSVPTFAKVELDDRLETVVTCDVLFFDEDGQSSPISTAGFLERLQ